MSSDDRVAKVVTHWARLAVPPLDTAALSVLWVASNAATPFQPNAVRRLIANLQSEFQHAPPINVVLATTDFDPGNIKTVNDLKTAVAQMP
jgi:hypothetical protein